MDKKSKLFALAALGLVMGTMGTMEAAEAPSTCVAPTPDQTQNLFSKLDSAHLQMFNSMSCEGQKLTMQLANQTCAGQNGCKGLNSCKTDHNACKGQGSCKGTSKGPFTNKNDAVEVAQKHMAEQRMNSMSQ